MRSIRKVLLVGLAAAGLVAGLLPATASAEATGLPPGLHRCGGTVGGGTTDITGRIYNHGAVFQYYVRVRPAPPFGWSGSVKVNSMQYPPRIIPVGTSHTYKSPVIIPWRPTASVGYHVVVQSNEGVFNNYGVEVFAPYSCTFTVH